MDPTTSHTPQENSIAERLNKTLMNRVRSTLNTARLPFRLYWAYCLLDTTQKTNAMYHRGISDIPLRVFQQHRISRSPFPTLALDLRQYRTFGEFAYIPILRAIKTKADPRAVLVRYLFQVDPYHYKVMDATTGHLHVARIVNYKPYNPAFDPQRTYYHAIPPRTVHNPHTNQHHALPRMAYMMPPATRQAVPKRPPRSLIMARTSKNSPA